MQDLTTKSLKDLRPLVREGLKHEGHFEAVVADAYIAQELRDVAYRWGNRLMVPVATRGKSVGVGSLHVEFSTWCKDSDDAPATSLVPPVPTYKPVYLWYLEGMPSPEEENVPLIQVGTEMTFTVTRLKEFDSLGDVEIVLRYNSSK
jgi:hypothetical protein